LQLVSNNVGLHSHHEPGVGQLRSTNEDCVPTAAIYRQTINDNVLWTVITRMSLCVMR